MGNMVLLVDDEPLIRELGQMMIESLGYAVVVAGSGVEALVLAVKHRADLFVVICDLGLPEMDGWQIIEALHGIAPDLPVILSSGDTIDPVVREGRPYPPWAVMNKPYNFSTLEDILQKVPIAGSKN